jgi:hypothetical protein
MFGFGKKETINMKKKEYKKLLKDFHKENKKKGKIASIKFS